MVPDSDVPNSDPSQPAATDGARVDSDASSAALDNLQDRDAYNLVYRATRDALWDVLGTATLILFHLALVAVGLSAAVGGIGPFVRGSAGNGAAILGVVGLAVALFAGVRVYRLVTE